MSYDNIRVAIIGAGTSGLFLAKKLSEDDRFQMVVFEKNRQVAAKVRASGGGKANIFNREVRPEHYNVPGFVSEVLSQFSPEDLDNQFSKWGLVTVSDEEGRVYPASQFSQTVVDVLCDLPGNVRFELHKEVQSIDCQDDKWRIDDCPELFDYIVLASGSPANIIPKNRTHYNDYLKSINLNTNPLRSSLSGFILKDYPKSLSGCRTKAIVSLCQGKKLIHKELGEITFKDDGVSGIVVMNMSAYYWRLASQDNCRLEINLCYWDEHFDVKGYLSHNHNLTGLLHPKLAALYQQKPFSVTRFSFPIAETYPLETAQVCHGGVDLSEIDVAFRARRYPNMFILGEMLDVDGLCGGYNLFFAFASAGIAAKKLAESSRLPQKRR